MTYPCRYCEQVFGGPQFRIEHEILHQRRRTMGRMIQTTLGPMDEDALICHEDDINTDEELTHVVEYCLRGCSGEAHRTGRRERPEYFCAQHVHRSVEMYLKKGLFGSGVSGGL